MGGANVQVAQHPSEHKHVRCAVLCCAAAAHLVHHLILLVQDMQRDWPPLRSAASEGASGTRLHSNNGSRGTAAGGLVLSLLQLLLFWRGCHQVSVRNYVNGETTNQTQAGSGLGICRSAVYD